MLRQTIQDQMKQAMKDRDQVRLSALRFLWSEIKNAEIDAKVELDNSGVEAVVMREVKKRKDVIEQMKEAGREENVAEEQAQLDVLMEFMPEQMSREDVEKIVDEVITGGADNFGAAMGQVMAKVKGQADGKLVQELVKEKMG